ERDAVPLALLVDRVDGELRFIQRDVVLQVSSAPPRSRPAVLPDPELVAVPVDVARAPGAGPTLGRRGMVLLIGLPLDASGQSAKAVRHRERSVQLALGPIAEEVGVRPGPCDPGRGRAQPRGQLLERETRSRHAFCVRPHALRVTAPEYRYPSPTGIDPGMFVRYDDPNGAAMRRTPLERALRVAEGNPAGRGRECDAARCIGLSPCRRQSSPARCRPPAHR